MYAIGSYILREPYRESGRRPRPTTRHCTLILSGLHPGSTIASLEVADMTPSLLEGEKPLGVRCLEIMDDVITSIVSEDDPTESVSKRITDERYRARVASELFEMWPQDETSGLQIRIGRAPHKILTFKHRPRLELLMKGPETSRERSVVGPVIKVDLIRKDKRRLTLWTPDGKVDAFFDPVMIESVRKHVGSIVEVKGDADLDSEGRIVAFSNIRFIEPKTHMEIRELAWDDARVKLRGPLSVTMDVDLVERVWTLENDILGIVSIGGNWAEAFSQFQEEFFFLRDNYLKAKDEELTPRAVELRKKLANILR